ncbi:MAG: Hpt domain-containing protein [Dechloromonas sp.]|nr:Hpt domain-containing protein [Dechloromonas sp.]
MMLIPQELEGFDVRDAVARMLDRPELWWQAVGFFVHHFSGWEAAWLEVRDNDQAERRCVHAIRSAAANVGAMRLAALAERLEKILLRRIAGEDVNIPVDLRAELAAAFAQAWKSAEAAWREAGCELPGQS